MERIPPGFDGLVVAAAGNSLGGAQVRLLYVVGRRQTLEVEMNSPATSLGGSIGAHAALGGRGAAAELLFSYDLERARGADVADATASVVVARARLRPHAALGGEPAAGAPSRAEAEVVGRMAERTARMLQRAVAAALRASLREVREDLNAALREQAAAEGARVSAEVVELELPAAASEYPLLTPLPLREAGAHGGADAVDHWALSWSTHSLRLVVRLARRTALGAVSSTVSLSRLAVDADVCSSATEPARVWLPRMPKLSVDVRATGAGAFAVRTGLVRRAIEAAVRRHMVYPNYVTL